MRLKPSTTSVAQRISRPYMDQRLLRVQSPSTGAIQPYTNTHWMRARRSSDGIGVGMNINASLIMR